MESASTFRFLHISDFHMCNPPQANFLFGSDAFLTDLSTLEPEKLNLVVLSGDFVNKACWHDASKVELARFVRRISSLAPNTVFVAVPGNHDLERATATPEHQRMMTTWDTDLQMRNWFFDDPQCPLRAYVTPAFAQFSAWWNSLAVRKLSPSKSGILPGDCGGTVEFRQWHVGVLCLNTAFPCLTERASGDSDLAQLTAVGGPKWCRDHDLCIIVTHDPISHFDRRTRFQREFLSTGYFALHLFGDMHESLMQNILLPNGVAWHQWQAGTLFGPTAPEIGFGYAIGEIDFTVGRIRAYPRRRYRQVFGPDPELVPRAGPATGWHPIVISASTQTEPPESIYSTDFAGVLPRAEPSLPDWPRPFEILIPFKITDPREAGIAPTDVMARCRQLLLTHDFTRALALFHHFSHQFYFVQNAFDSSCAILKALIEGIDSQLRPGWLTWATDALGSFTGRLGQPARAVDQYSRALSLANNAGCPSKNLAMILGNRFLELVRLGHLMQARTDQDSRIAILRNIAEDDADAAFQLATAYLGSAYLRIMTAELDFAEAECELAECWFRKSDRGDVSFLPIARAILALERNEDEPSEKHVGVAERYAEEASRHAGAETGRDRIRALWALGVSFASRAALKRDASLAEKGRSRLRQALLECQCIDLKEIEPDILLGLARVERRIELAQEAQEIAASCGYELKKIDAQLVQAHLHLGNNLENAKTIADSAASESKRLGYQRGANAAERILRQIGN